MTTRYRVDYALKSHRRDQLIEFIKGCLGVPFVLLSQPTNVHEDAKEDRPSVNQMARDAFNRYSQIMQDIEEMIADHITHQKRSDLWAAETDGKSKLKMLVPTVGNFFTPLPLKDAFEWQDKRRFISHRRFVAPSFNDVRLVLNTAQIMSLTRNSRLDLMTFDGDVTLYDDGENLNADSPCISRIIALMRKGVKVGIVTAAGYTEAHKYYERLYGLLDAVAAAGLPARQLVVMGGEANFLFAFSPNTKHKLVPVAPEDWHLPEMRNWTEENIKALLDVAESALNQCVKALCMPVTVLRKPRAVGIYPPKGIKLAREQLEETVLVTQRIVEQSSAGKNIPFCAFNGGNDVFVDIGDKSWGVLACQRYFGGIEGSKSLHVGDQFLSAGANDFKARLACTTAWIASPAETVTLMDEIQQLQEKHDINVRHARGQDNISNGPLDIILPYRSKCGPHSNGISNNK